MACVYVVCVCLSEREGERERCLCVCERERERDRCVCVCVSGVCVRARTAGTADSNINIRYCLLSGHGIKQLQAFNNPPVLDVTRRTGTQHRSELPAATLAWHNNNEYSGSKEHLPCGSTKALYNEQ